jgi:hypothetical protein
VVQPGVGEVDLLGGVFKVDGRAAARGRPAPRLDEHRGELLARDTAERTAASRRGEA